MRAAPPPPAKVVWDDAARVEGGVRVRMGGFVSPAERYLSPESRTARFMMVTPMHAAAEPTCSSTSYSSRGVAIIFPSTGDQWYWYVGSRLRLRLGPPHRHYSAPSTWLQRCLISDGDRLHLWCARQTARSKGAFTSQVGSALQRVERVDWHD
jgi:hypothetical protein